MLTSRYEVIICYGYHQFEESRDDLGIFPHWDGVWEEAKEAGWELVNDRKFTSSGITTLCPECVIRYKEENNVSQFI